MCGITGTFAPGGLPRETSRHLCRMVEALRHRGPDDNGQWLDEEAGIALGARRLAVMDLSPEGHMPMHSAGGRYVITYNGEVYNLAELRAELTAGGSRFRGHSDTEVLLAAVERWGLTEALRRSAGMFAFALWDRDQRLLHLVRDRMGEKPLYWTARGESLVFGSELGALRLHPAWRGEVDRGALSLLLRYGYVPAPFSIFRDVRKVPPGTILSFSHPSVQPAETVYWSLRQAAERGAGDPLPEDLGGIADRLEESLRTAVRGQMVADVPLGAFLSGGIDSSTVVALMRQESARPVRTFTIGFTEPAYDEAGHARAVARHLGTEHTEVYVTPGEALDVISRVPSAYDEPLGDVSAVPTLLLCALARRHVTVCLSGDGGDEVLGGYSRYPRSVARWRALSRMPLAARRLAAGLIPALPPAGWDSVAKLLPGLPRRLRRGGFGMKLHGLAELLPASSAGEYYGRHMSLWPPAQAAVLGATVPVTLMSRPEEWLQESDFFSQMMYVDQQTYLPDDILVKVDRASMSVSLETRAPLLDHRVVELAWRIPFRLRAADGRGKLALRAILKRYVPESLTERPKMGFGVPLAAWLRGPLREWAEDLLSRERLRREGYLDATAVRSLWDAHQDCTRDAEYPLWSILMFQAWLTA